MIDSVDISERQNYIRCSLGIINDHEAAKMTHDFAQSIEDQLTYPGEVKVVVMRETRAMGVAK